MNTRIIKQCAFCGEDFHLTASRKLCCCGAHTKEYRRQKSEELFPWKYQLRECANEKCESQFYPGYADQMFHSKSCSAQTNNVKRGCRSAETKQKISDSVCDRLRLNLPNRILVWNTCVICGKMWSIGTKKSTRQTCSGKCLTETRSRTGRKSAATRITRSKDEIALYQLCFEHFSKVTHNEVIHDGWDADIVIHDTKTAVLWNGPWHYRQMEHKNHSLLQVQTRDKIKSSVFIEHGWNVVVFEDRYYTPRSAFTELMRPVGFEPTPKKL